MRSPTFRRLLATALAALAATELGVWAGVRVELAGLIGAAVAVLCAYLLAVVQRRRINALRALAGEFLQTPVEAQGDELMALEQSIAAVAHQTRELTRGAKLESARREAILAGMAEGVLAVDRDLRVIFSNAAMLHALGTRAPLGERVRLLEVVRDRELVDLLADAVRTGETQKRRLKLAGERERLYEVQAAPFELPGGEGAIAILHDITDLERLEQVRKDFVANVSHELRTPLAGIIGYSETLLDGALEDRENSRKFLTIIHANAVRLNSIASDLLVLSELESKVDAPERERLNVDEVVDSVLATVCHEAKVREVEVIKETWPETFVAGTRLRLEQALLNLVINAIKFNIRGGQVRIAVKPRDEGRVAISVADTGVGIPSQDLPRIFERFYRVDKGRSREVGGTGLGLTIVKHVIERMDGAIEVHSQLREGSEFTIVLPSA